MNRNFRSTYLQTLGFHGVQDGVQVKLFLESILLQHEVDLQKLSKLCTTFGIPSGFRVQVWKILLGICSNVIDSEEFITDLQNQEYEYLKYYYKILLETSGEDFRELDADIMTGICLLSKGKYVNIEEIHKDKSSQEYKYSHLKAIVTVFMEFCDSPVDAFCLCKALLSTDSIIHKPMSFPEEDHILKQIQMLEVFLEKEHKILHQHLVVKLGIPVSSFSFRWFQSFFAECFSVACTARIWDRIIGGPPLTSVCIALSIVTTKSPSLLILRSKNSILQSFLKLSNLNVGRIITLGVQYYEKFGGHSSNTLFNK